MPATATSTASRPDEAADAPVAPKASEASGSLEDRHDSPAPAPKPTPAKPNGAPVMLSRPKAEAPAAGDTVSAQLEAEQKKRKAAEKKEKALRAELSSLKSAQGKVDTRPGSTPPNKAGDSAAPRPQTAAESMAVVRAMRRKRALKLALRLTIFVLLPTALSSIYYLVYATDQYESHAAFTIHSADARASAGIESLIALGTGSASTATDTLVVREYILSRDVLARLDKEHGFIAHYKSPKYDWLSRLASDASFEDAYEYYQNKVSAEFQSTSGTVALRVRAFSPEAAKRFASALMQYSEEKVNILSERERKDRISFAQAEVKEQEGRLVKARASLLRLQQDHGDINPLKSAEAAFSIKTGLEAELARTQAELTARQAYLTPDAAEVVQLRAKASALSGQIAAENRKLVDPKKNRGVAELAAQFEAAGMEKEFAEKAYAASVTALELSRSDATRQHRYLIPVTDASLADESTYPKTGQSIAGVSLVSLLAMGILSLIVAAIREHANI